MSTAVTIENLTNLRTGTTCACVISGTPTGILSFVGSRNPDVSPPQPLAFTGSGTNYVLTVPFRGLWYIWAEDGHGRATEPEACYIGLSDSVALDEAGEGLEARLEANRKGLDAILRTLQPNSKVKQISYGVPANILDFPSILITQPSRTSERDGVNYLQKHTYRFQIAFLIMHPTEENQLSLAVRFAELAATQILNQSAYDRMALPCGEVLVQVYAAQGDYADFELEGLGFCATGTLIVTAMSRTQERTA